jgi:hypothetical protein
VRRWGSIEYDDPAATSSAKHQREPFIYLIEPIDPADQVIGIDFLVEIQIGEHRKIDSRPHRAVRSAAHHLFATPSEKGLSAPSGESWDPDQHRSLAPNAVSTPRLSVICRTRSTTSLGSSEVADRWTCWILLDCVPDLFYPTNNKCGDRLTAVKTLR